MTKTEIHELRKSLREKTEGNEKLQSGTSTSTICTVCSSTCIFIGTSIMFLKITKYNVNIYFLIGLLESVKFILCNESFGLHLHVLTFNIMIQ